MCEPLTIEVTLQIDPRQLRTAQQKGVRVANIGGRNVVMHYVKPEIQRAHRILVGQLSHLGTRMDDGRSPWLYEVMYVYGTTDKKLYGKLKVTRPDGDNITKGLLDAITDARIAWADDAQAHCDGCHRRYIMDKTEPPHIELKLTKIGD
jgi:Holliday junction resolvase RusA-like endonuclease